MKILTPEALFVTDDGRSGTVNGFVDGYGQRALYVDPGVNDRIEMDEIDLTTSTLPEYSTSHHLLERIINPLKHRKQF